jgi:lysine 2,3-aminomutase
MKFVFPATPKPENVSLQDWSSWSWQLRKSLQSQSDFETVFTLSDVEKQAFSRSEGLFNIRVTPYYAGLCQQHSEDPLRKILMPSGLEFAVGAQSQLDPLGERKNNPAPRIVHRYPDRVLFLVTDLCSVYCRYCTRKHFTGHEQAFPKESEYTQALAYIRSHPGIREVILSGGDPLTLSDSQLSRVLSDLRGIEHVEIIRIGTRMPVVCPMRITPALIECLKPHRPIYMMVHFNHPRELSLEAKTALDLLSDAGIPLMNQMVLLRGVNNHPAIVQALSRRLLYLRVKPYYMFQCDPSHGTDHLRTSVEESEQIQQALWGHLSGLAMPTLSLDIPSGGGKTTLAPNFEISRDDRGRTYRGFDGVVETYKNPLQKNSILPQGIEEYLQEWEALKAAKRGADSGPKPSLSEHTWPQTF